MDKLSESSGSIPVETIEYISDIDSIFDWSSISIEVLDKSYVRYEPYNLKITHRHPLRKHRKVFKADPIQIVKHAIDVIVSTYPIAEDQFQISEDHDKIIIGILLSDVENNVEIIEDAMNKLGFTRGKTAFYVFQDLKGRNWFDIRFLIDKCKTWTTNG